MEKVKFTNKCVSCKHLMQVVYEKDSAGVVETRKICLMTSVFPIAIDFVKKCTAYYEYP